MKESRSLHQQTVVVTGSSSGIGKATAVALGARGANVIVNYRSDRDGAEDAVAKIEQAGAQAIAVRADVSNEDDVRRLFAQAVESFSQIDVLIGNAGIQQDSSLEHMTLEQWKSVIDTNLTSQFLCVREAVRDFLRADRKQHTRARGRIVCISSVHELIPWAGHVNYAASKGGLMQLVKSAAQELSPQRIRINGIAPGAIKTRINERAWSTPEAERELLKLIPYGRIGHTDDVVGCVEFLISDAADYVQGTTLFVDGGMALYPEFAHGG
jgi:glucose 1-dehydrogenase